MAKSYYSTVFEQSAAEIWTAIRDFGTYEIWVETVTASHIEDRRRGDSVGSVRNVTINGSIIRQRLLAHSDADRCYTYEFADAGPDGIRDYRATIRITPVVDGDHAFVEWWATFDCEPSEVERRTDFYAKSFAGWLESLRARLGGRPKNT